MPHIKKFPDRKIFVTADEHYGHKNIIKYNNRPFESVEEMDAGLIKRHNSRVKRGDLVIHCGDFAMIGSSTIVRERYIKKLRGEHIFLAGDHDKWLKKSALTMYVVRNAKAIYVCCHYPMRIWPLQHYGAFHVYGHSHGRSKDFGRSLDVGVDSWNYYPMTLTEVREHFSTSRKLHREENLIEAENLMLEEARRGAVIDRET